MVIMWESIAALGQNPITLVFVIGLLAIIFYGVKKGYFSFKGKGVQIGTAATEAKIRTMQEKYAKALFESTIRDLPKECEYYHKRFVIAQCLDEVQRMIQFNHITSDDVYIETEFQIIFGIVKKYTTMDYFDTDEFKSYLRNLIAQLVKQLEKIRKTYGE